MVNAFLSVVADLFAFVFRRDPSQLLLPQPRATQRNEAETVLKVYEQLRKPAGYLNPPPTPVLVPERTEPVETRNNAGESELMAPAQPNVRYALLDTPVFTTANPTPVFVEPAVSYDGIQSWLPYGSQLVAGECRGGFVAVSHKATDAAQAGWVQLSHIVTDQKDVLPQLVESKTYTSENMETVKLRTVINDPFAGGLLKLPLQDVEYVTYRLTRANLALPWPEVRPRVAGTWQYLLKGQSGVHLSIYPHARSVMETRDEGDPGHVMYVEAVYPDESISVSEVADGAFRKRTLDKPTWRELRPVFIACT